VVQLALDVLPAFQIANTVLKEGLVAVNTKYSSLCELLVKTNATLKSLNDWSIAYDFSKIIQVYVPPVEKVPFVASVIQADVVRKTSEVQSVGGVGKVDGASDLAELSIIDLDNMFA